jgi:biopolymer transport protein ExbD
MYTLSRRVGSTVLLCLALLGCSLLSKDKDKLPPGAAAENEPGRPLADIELPVSLRHKDSAPTNPRTVEATDEQLRLDGNVVIGLERGRVAKTDIADGTIPKLEAMLRSTTASTVAMRLQANLPYETMALVLSTARKVGISNAAFAVREVGAGKTVGWLNADGYVMSSKADDLPPITAVPLKSWNDFTNKWQPTFDGCRTAPNGNCAYVTENVAIGGTLKLELFASGRGINIDFFRRGLNPVQEADEEKMRAQVLARKKEDFLQGRISHDEMVEAILLGDPSTYALFQFRYQEALKSPSALTKTMAPMCHSERCGVLVTGDSVVATLNVISMIGAAFPDGTPAPAFGFEMPWTERPKPPVLAEFIAQQQAL